MYMIFSTTIMRNNKNIVRIQDIDRNYLSENHPLAGRHIFGMFDKSEVNQSLIARPQTIL